MRIVIDMQGAQTGSRFRGIGRYTMSLAQAMVRHRGKHEVILLLNGMFPDTLVPIRTAFQGLLSPSQIRVWNAVGPVCTDGLANIGRRYIAQAIREDYIRSLKPDVVHITSFFEGFGDNAVHSIKMHPKNEPTTLTAVTFYDVIPLIQRDVYLDPNPHFSKPYLEKIEQIKSADLLLAISDSSRNEAIKCLGFSPNQVLNISTAVDNSFEKKEYSDEEHQVFKAKLKIRGRFIMYSGATDERKNHLGLISAYAMLAETTRATYQLVLMGGLPVDHLRRFERHIEKCGLGRDRVIITGRVSDDDMIHAYNICDLYVFPSWHEGFGLPVLEAMSCGAPVIGANTTSIPEVIGFKRALFDPHSPRAIAEKIEEVLSDPLFLSDLKAHSPVQAAKFSWDESAERALKAMEALVLGDKSGQIDTQKDLPLKPSSVLVDEIASIILANQGIDLPSLAQAMAYNVTSSQPQLLIDVSELVRRDSRSGIQRVVRSILQEWLSSPPKGFDLRLVYADEETMGYRYADRFTRKFLNQEGVYDDNHDVVDDLFIDFSSGDVFFGLDMQHEVQIFQGEFYQRLRGCGVRVAFLIYDLLPLTLPHCFPVAASANHALWISSVARADSVVCISQAVAAEFNDWFLQHHGDSISKPEVNYFRLGANIESSVPTTGLPENAGTLIVQFQKAPCFLMVGTIEPRKGHAQVLEAFSLLWERGISCNLVLVGRGGWGVDDVREKLREHPEAGRQLFWIDSASDEYLEEIYAASTCLIAASYGEGFGLPLIEAAQHKLPIIARDIPVFHEVAAEHAYYFNAEQPGELAEALRAWLALYREAKHPRSDAMPWLTWEQSATELAEILLASDPGPGRCHGTSPDGGIAVEPLVATTSRAFNGCSA
jgi:glycosyltransferase involved in cell wall biosynthesis